MAIFSYRARQPDGTPKEGTIDAVDLDAANAALYQLGLTVDELHAATQSEQQAFTPAPPEPPSTVSPEWSIDSTPPPPNITNPTNNTSNTHSYHPLTDTLRLYVGWMLAWYALIYGLGAYQYTRDLSFQIPFVSGLFLSPLVLSFTTACYLFLLLTQRSIETKTKGLLVGVLGIAIFYLFRMLS